MKLNRSSAFWNRESLNDINENWDKIEEIPSEVSEMVERVEEIANLENEKNSYVYNELRNGNFTNGTEYWNALSGSAISASNNKLIITGDGSNRIASAEQSTFMKYEEHRRDRIYIKGTFRVTNSNCDYCGYAIYGSDATGGIIYNTVDNPSNGQNYTISGIATLSNTGAGSVRVQARASYPNGNAANKKSLELSKTMTINLTKAFGAGNEPSKLEMDELVNKIGWFEGSSGLSYFVKESEKRITEIEKNMNTIEGYEFTNKINNGDFVNNITGWNAESGTTITASNNQMIIEGTGANANPRAHQELSDTYISGNKYFAQAEFEVKNNDCNDIRLVFYGSVNTGGIQSEIINDISQGGKYTLNRIFEASPTGTGNVRLQLRSSYGSSENAKDKEIAVGKVIMYNLTQIFGVGNEPTKEEFENLLNYIKQPQNIKIGDMQQALFRYISNHSGSGGFKKRPLIMLTFDDGFMSDYEIAYPILKERGIVATSYIWTDRTNNYDNAMNWEHLHELKAAGWGIECHTHDHLRMGQQTEEEMHRQFRLVNENFVDNGLPTPKYHAWPFGSQTAVSRQIGMQYRDSLRRINPYGTTPYNTYEDIDFSQLSARSSDIRDNNVDTRLDEIKGIVEDTYNNNGILILYSHEMKHDGAGDYETAVAYYEELVDHALAVGFRPEDFVTNDEMFNRVQAFRLANQ